MKPKSLGRSRGLLPTSPDVLAEEREGGLLTFGDAQAAECSSKGNGWNRPLVSFHLRCQLIPNANGAGRPGKPFRSAFLWLLGMPVVNSLSPFWQLKYSDETRCWSLLALTKKVLDAA